MPDREESGSNAPAAALTEVIRVAMTEWQVPGASVAVATPSGVWCEGFGLADVENAVPATPDTVYRLASISKPITAVAVMQLAERGRIDLDADIRQVVPSFSDQPWPVTTRQLLGHLGGVGDDSRTEEPGTAFRYTTHGYTLLGCVIEAVAGTDYLTYVRENVLQPAGMQHTGPDDPRAIIPRRARGYAFAQTDNGPQLQNAEFADVTNHLAGGGFCGTAMDIVRFGIALHSGVLLRPETQEEMFTRLRLRGGRESRYGLGWFVWTYRDEREVAHGGKYIGASTMFSLRPASGIAVAFLTNREGLNSSHMHQLTRRLGDIAAGLID